MTLGGEFGYDSGFHGQAEVIMNLGVGCGCGAQRLWFIGNDIHHNAEDSIQFGHQCQTDPPTGLYVGLNYMHGDRENAVDLKWARDVVVSENVMQGYRPAPTDQEFCFDDGSGCYPAGYYDSGSDGAAMIVGSDGTTDHVWVLFNTISDSELGIRNEAATTTWLIGNVLFDIAQGGVVLEKSAEDLFVLNNTFVDVDTAIDQSVQENFRLTVVNNIIAAPRSSALHIESTTITEISTLRNNLL